MRSMMLSMVLAGLAVGAAAPVAHAEVSLPPFYAAVSKLKPEGKLGQVLKMQRVSTPIPGAQAWRIAYVSSDLHDRKTISTALLVAPVGKPPKGGRPIVSWAHGTTGTAQNCGPSQVENPAVPLNEYFLVNGNSWTDYGIAGLDEFIKRGYVAVATDYQGLGGGGIHQYTVSATNGRDAINAIRAAGALKETGAGKKAILYGWSQGGAAVLAAGSSGDYIAKKGTAFDGIEIVGVVGLAPADTAALAPAGPMTDEQAAAFVNGSRKLMSGDLLNFSHLVMNLLGTQAAFPDTLKLTDWMTDEGAKALETILTNKCVHVTADTLKFNYGDKFGDLLKPEVSNVRAWADALVGGSAPNAKPVAPVMIYWGSADTVVEPSQGATYRTRMCALGGNVARVELPGSQTHFTVPPTAEPLYVPWIADRFAGKPVADGCATQ
ncbi:MAG: alpha/beta fold hydrolase [Hyphomicrobiales bacterium]